MADGVDLSLHPLYKRCDGGMTRTSRVAFDANMYDWRCKWAAVQLNAGNGHMEGADDG